MKYNNKITVVLFALTGFGNTVLSALLKDPRVKVSAVFTVKYNNPFPYYEERQLLDLCAELEIVCYSGVNVSSEEGVKLLRKHSPDLIVVATFKQILKENVINLPPLGVVNFHPSLLPRYRGSCPTNAALLHGDEVSGVTVHYLTKNIDDGNILLQRRIAINDIENDGQLRYKLAVLAGNMVPELISMFLDHPRPAGTPQDNSLACPAPRPTLENGYLELAKDVNSLRRKIRAFNPLPGTSILVEGRRVNVDRFELLPESVPDGFYATGNYIDVVINGEAIRLFKSTNHLKIMENHLPTWKSNHE